MRKIFSGFRKELLILIRDLPGLAILFLMPVLLVLVVTLAQENTLKNQVAKTAILLAAPGSSVLCGQITGDFDSSGLFITTRVITDDTVTVNSVSLRISEGDFPAGIVITNNDSAVILITDPALHESYRKSMLSAVHFLLKGAQVKVHMNKLMGFMPSGTGPESFGQLIRELPPIREIYAVKERSAIKPTPVQNNVPGFILFAMFFIVIPLSGSLVIEKNEGPYLRLRTLPVPVISVLGSKAILYLIVCLVQFVLMMFVGTWFLHTFFGLPRLDPGHRYSAMILATLAAAFAAVGFGTIIGALARTHSQAALTGSLLVVILGIISGTFLPIHTMPEAIRKISLFSPMRWGIDNYIDIFVRGGNIRDILPRTLCLLLFFIFAMIFSMHIFSRWKKA
jgi:ABC-2 type transport system permease protein